MKNTHDKHDSARSEYLKPVEFLALSAGAAAFTGVVTLVSTRDFSLASVAAGATFVVVLVVIAMLLVGRTDRRGRNDEGSEQQGSASGDAVRQRDHYAS